nr:gag pol polyprotein [Hymenolepis microstoma]
MSKETRFVISLSAPTFDPEHPAIWFTQLEMLLQLVGVTDQRTWFQYAVYALPQNIAIQFPEITSKTLDNTSYDQLKEAVINRFSVPKEKRIEQLFALVELGDRSPSQLLRHMRSLACDFRLSDEVLKKLWMKCLPGSMVPFVLTSPCQDDLDRLAVVADRIHNHHDGPTVNSVKTSAAADTVTQRLDALTEQHLTASQQTVFHFAYETAEPIKTRRHDVLLPQNIREQGQEMSAWLHICKKQITRLRGNFTPGSKARLSLAISLKNAAYKQPELPCLRPTAQRTSPTAKVRKPSIGADFLPKFRLLVNLRDSALHYKVTSLQIVCLTQTLNSFGLNTLLLCKSVLEYLTEISEPKHEVRHHSTTQGQPVFARSRLMHPGKLRVAKQEFQHVASLGVVRPSNSPSRSPLHIFAKKNRDRRPCGDYRALNQMTLDLVRAHHQIPMIAKTAVVTPFGLFEYLRLPFGLRSAAQCFQRFMDQVFRGLDFVFTYIGDVLIAISNSQGHKQHLRQMFERIPQYGITINPDKCKFGQAEIDFLGHHVNGHGITSLPEKAQFIMDYPVFQSVKKVFVSS